MSIRQNISEVCFSQWIFYTGPTSARANQMDLFGESLLGDLMDSSPSVPPTAPVDNTANHEVDLFADATFQSASHGEATSASHAQVGFLFVI